VGEAEVVAGTEVAGLAVAVTAGATVEADVGCAEVTAGVAVVVAAGLATEEVASVPQPARAKAQINKIARGNHSFLINKSS